MARKFIIGLSILFYALSGIVLFKALTIPTKNTFYHDNSSIVTLKELSPEPEDISSQFSKEQAANRTLVKELQGTIAKLERELSNKNKEPQAKGGRDTTEIRHETIEALSTADNFEKRSEPRKDIVLEEENTNVDNANKSIRKTMANDQYGSRKIYTIQTGSFNSVADAQKHYDFIVQGLSKKELNFLRIEKIGKYHTVRMGKFESYTNIEKLLQAIKPQLSTAIIMKAYIIDERIIRLYKDKISSDSSTLHIFNRQSSI